jgi:hypothetical protein
MVYNDNSSSPFLFVAESLWQFDTAPARSALRCGNRIKAPDRLGHRHRRGLPSRNGHARRNSRATKLFAPGHRLQPPAGIGDVDSNNQRAHPDTGKHQPRWRPKNLRACARFYTTPVHGEQRGLHHVAIEVRQDLIVDSVGQQAWGALLARLLPQAYRELAAAETLRLA